MFLTGESGCRAVASRTAPAAVLCRRRPPARTLVLRYERLGRGARAAAMRPSAARRRPRRHTRSLRGGSDRRRSHVGRPPRHQRQRRRRRRRTTTTTTVPQSPAPTACRSRNGAAARLGRGAGGARAHRARTGRRSPEPRYAGGPHRGGPHRRRPIVVGSTGRAGSPPRLGHAPRGRPAGWTRPTTAGRLIGRRRRWQAQRLYHVLYTPDGTPIWPFRGRPEKAQVPRPRAMPKRARAPKTSSADNPSAPPPQCPICLEDLDWSPALACGHRIHGARSAARGDGEADGAKRRAARHGRAAACSAGGLRCARRAMC